MPRKNVLRTHVEYILKTYPNTANDDIELMLYLWVTFHQHRLVWEERQGTGAFREGQEGQWMVPLGTIRSLPSEDKIARIRRKFQEEGMYKATDPKVIARRSKEKKIRETINTESWDEHL